MNNEEDNIKSIEWVDINPNLKDLLPYQKYLESEDNKFTLYGWE